MINIRTFIFNPFAENTYVLYDETGECVIIDAGNFDNAENEELLKFLSENSLKPVKLLNTHGHIDHIFGLKSLKSHFGIQICGHKADDEILDNTKKYGEYFGVNVSSPPKVDCYLDETSVVTFGNSKLAVIHLPGHTPGGIAFYHMEQKILFSGDVLFQDSIGRSDLPGGDYDTLISNINNKLMVLPEDVTVYPGHGEATTIGHEKRLNPFL